MFVLERLNKVVLCETAFLCSYYLSSSAGEEQNRKKQFTLRPRRKTQALIKVSGAVTWIRNDLQLTAPLKARRQILDISYLVYFCIAVWRADWF